MLKRERFDSLDALRFFAFLRVFLFHTYPDNLPAFEWLCKGGENGVTFFFTLSGFLISYLLICEKNNTGQINFRSFIFRRVLRIWPLYFVMAGVAYSTPFLLSLTNLHHSAEGYQPDWRFTIAFLENYRIMIENTHPNVAPLWVMWSLCVEEHYYILWGIIFTFIPLRKIPLLFAIMVPLAVIARKTYSHYGLEWIDLPTNMDTFAMGGLAAFAFVKYRVKIKTIVSGIPSALGKLLLILLLIFTITEWRLIESLNIWIYRSSILALIFAAFLLFLVSEGTPVKISGKLLNWLGTISYGLYLIHTVSNSIIKSLLQMYNIDITTSINTLLYVVIAFTTVVACSAVSYYLIEKPFLKLKPATK